MRVKSTEVNSNFKDVLESAYESYEDNESRDYIGVILTKMEESNDIIDEALKHQSESFLLNEELDEELVVVNPHIVHEKKGNGISVTINGKEYRYVAKDRSTGELFRSFMGMYSHANSGFKALNWLKKNALQYYQKDANDYSEEGAKKVGIVESRMRLKDTNA